MNLPDTLITQLGGDSFYATSEADLPCIQLVSKGKYVDHGLIQAGHYATLMTT